jgi:hypothetical protein
LPLLARLFPGLALWAERRSVSQVVKIAAQRPLVGLGRADEFAERNVMEYAAAMTIDLTPA